MQFNFQEKVTLKNTNQTPVNGIINRHQSNSLIDEETIAFISSIRKILDTYTSITHCRGQINIYLF